MIEETRSLTAARRAASLMDLSRRFRSRENLTAEAGRHFDLVSARDRIRMPALWATILLETKPTALRAALPGILRATLEGGRVSHQLAGSWMLDRRIPDEVKPLLRGWVTSLQDWELEPSVRHHFEAFDASDATKAGRIRDAGVHLRRMARWARYTRNIPRIDGLLREAMKIEALRPRCREYVDVALQRLPRHRRPWLRLRARLKDSSR